jgi:formylglycine-generating enzyme required for sulfatase activity
MLRARAALFLLFLVCAVAVSSLTTYAQGGTPPPPTGTLAPTDTPTPTHTPAPTATLTLPEQFGVSGVDEAFRERFIREYGLWLLLGAIALAAVVTWLLRPFVSRAEKRVEKVAERVLPDPQPKPPPDPFAEATRAYLERFEKFYSRFSFRGLEDVSGAKVPPFNKAYISLRLASPAAPRAPHKPDAPDDATRFLREEAAREVTLAEAVQQTPRLAIVGAAGCGKSTLLQWAGVSAARAQLPPARAEPLTDEQRAFVAALGAQMPLPVFIALRDFVKHCRPAGQPARAITPAALVEFIGHFYAEQFSSMTFPAGFFAQHLRRGCLLLLDGVDEVSPKDRAVVRNAVEGLTIDYGAERNRYLIASRSVAYKGEAEFSDFRQIEVQLLDARQRDELLRYWCDAIYLPEEARRNATDLSASIDRSDERVRDLARTPLMVSIFVLVYYHSQRHLPQQRAEFYYRAARVLVSETHKPGAPDYPEWERLSVETRIDYLKRMAYELYVRGQNTATAEELAEWAADEFANDSETARQFFTAAANRSGLLEEKGGQYGFFTHKTFHEFLTGLHLAQNLEDDPQDHWAAVLQARLTNDQWLEVTRLAAGSLAYLNAAKANKFVKLLSDLGDTDAEQTAALERAALAQADFPLDRAQANRAELAQRLERQMINLQLEPRFRRRLGLALAALGDPRFSPSPHVSRERGAGSESLMPTLVIIPSGEFGMGTSEDEEKHLKEKYKIEAWDDEKPQHPVFIPEFQIGRYLVTNAEFHAFVDAKGYENKDYWSDNGWRWRTGQLEPNLSWITDEATRKNYADWLARRPKEKRGQPFFWDNPQWNADNLPVVGVTWYEAEAYCKWLTTLTGQPFRLPTEAEWEKAARGPHSSVWPWGNTWDAERCNSEESKLGATTPVGMYPHGAAVWPDGPVEDLIGNVWEWCADWWQADLYAQRAGTEVRDPKGPEQGTARVVRGGSFFDLRGFCRAACRHWIAPGNFNDNIGFRVARSP